MVQFLAWATMAAASSRPYPYEWLTEEETYRCKEMDRYRKMVKDMNKKRDGQYKQIADEDRQRRRRGKKRWGGTRERERSINTADSILAIPCSPV